MVSTSTVTSLLTNWRADAGGSYRSWFLWEERLKNFRSIRRGLAAVVEDIENGNFGAAYRGSSLETVVHSVAEQRQIFKGADHAFLWKPKLRIPDIYENADNQRAFGRFLSTCDCCTSEAEIVAAIHALNARQIKGLGPAVAKSAVFYPSDLGFSIQYRDGQGLQCLDRCKGEAGQLAGISRDAQRCAAHQ